MLLKRDSAVTSTIYDSVASSKVFKACLVVSQGHLSPNLSACIPELTSLWCPISWTVQAAALFNHGGFPWQEAMTWSRSALCTAAMRYIVMWLSSPWMWIDSHPIICCFLFLLLPVVSTNCEHAFWVIISVATIEASGWTNWCLHRCSVSLGGASVEAPVIRLDLGQNAHVWSVSAAMTSRCGMVRKIITKRSGKSWIIYS